MSVNIKDVAREAGVSIATVSRVLSGRGSVHAQTRERVKKVAQEMSYVPSALGRNLSTKRTDTLGMVLPDLHGEFFSEILRGADEAAQRSGHHLLISSSHSKREEIESALRAMRGRVDGIVIMSPHIDAHTLHTNLPRNLPLVLLNTNLRGEEFISLNVDNIGGACTATRHLLAHGHTVVAIVTGSRGNLDAEERLLGYRKALTESGVPLRSELEIEGDFTERSGAEAARRILALQPRPTAIFFSNDVMAIGAISVLQDAGLRIPEDIAVVGFDDIPIARYLAPSLSSVHVDIPALGARAVERLVSEVTVEPPSGQRHITMTARLVPRDSCGCTSPEEPAADAEHQPAELRRGTP